MKIGMIVYSFTGKTKLVAERVAEILLTDGYEVDLNYLEPKEPLNLKAKEVEINEIPDPMRFDALVLGTPVQGGRMSAPMRFFLEQRTLLDGLDIVFIATHFFRREWGAVQTLQDLRKMCESKGGNVLGSIDIKWWSVFRQREIVSAIEHLRSLINNKSP